MDDTTCLHVHSIGLVVAGDPRYVKGQFDSFGECAERQRHTENWF
jgi:hypothetical protein